MARTKQTARKVVAGAAGKAPRASLAKVLFYMKILSLNFATFWNRMRVFDCILVL
jgi:hypothetical protein